MAKKLVDELDQHGAAHRARGDLLGEVRAAVRERRGDRQADADRAVDFVGHAGDEAAERGEPLSLDEIALRFACVQSGFGEPPLSSG